MADKTIPVPEEPIESEEPKESKEPPAPSKEPEKKQGPEPEAPISEEPEAEPEAEEPEEPPKPPSKRENLRIQQLLEKLKAQPQSQSSIPKTGLDYGTALDADPEVIKQLEEDRNKVASESYNQGVKLAESIQFRTLLEIDAPKIEAKYSQLDKESPDFDPDTANSINNWYLSTVGYDPKTGFVQHPGVRYSEFVEGLMELANRMAGEKAATTAKNITKQAGATGLRPSGGTAKGLNLNKPPEQMTDEELRAVLAQAGL